MVDTYAHYVREGDYPVGVPRETLDRALASISERWGTGETLEVTAPSRSDERFRDSRRVQQQAGRLTVGPFGGNLVGGLAEQLGVIVGRPGEQHHGTPAFWAARDRWGAVRAAAPAPPVRARSA